MRTLVVRLGALGDAVLTLPALANLLADGGTVTLVGVPASWGFLPADVPIQVVDADHAAWRPLFVGGPPAFSDFDRAVVMLGETGILVAEALRRLIPKVTHIRPVRPGESGIHAAVRLAGAVDAPAAGRLIAPASGPAHDLVLHPGSGGRAKRWPAERFFELARGSGNPLILLGPAEEGLHPAFAGLPVAEGWPLRRVVSVLASARSFVGNDSGVTHLASYLCPTLALFGPTDPAIWGPVGGKARLLSAPGGALDRLSVDEVARALAG